MRDLKEFEALLPHLIDREVQPRVDKLVEALHREFEETHLQAIEVFVRNVQSKLLSRISTLEGTMNRQAQAMTEVQEASARTEDNLLRLIEGIEKLSGKRIA